MPLQYVYRGSRDANNETHVTINGKPLRHVNYHSLDGFEWGYGGSGPADLALSILAHYFGEKHVNGSYLMRLKVTQDAPKCYQYHQDFKRDFIATWKQSNWQLTSEEIYAWVTRQQKERIS
jgi:hypothetical protein